MDTKKGASAVEKTVVQKDTETVDVWVENLVDSMDKKLAEKWDFLLVGKWAALMAAWLGSGQVYLTAEMTAENSDDESDA